MKYKATKTISLTMVLILLLAVFVGCGDALNGGKETTPSVNAGANPDNLGANNEEDDPTRVFTLDSLEPLSKEKQAEVEAAWIAAGNIPIWWDIASAERNMFSWCRFGNRYYGTYNDCIVICTSGSNKMIELGGHQITYFNFGIAMYVCHEGNILTIEAAYENKLISDDDIAKIVAYHKEMEDYYSIKLINEDIVFTLGDLEPLSREKQAEVEIAWITNNGYSTLDWCHREDRDWFFQGQRYYGTYNDCVVVFIGTGDPNNRYLEIADQKLEYICEFRIKVCKDGEFMPIDTAYEKGFLSDANIAEITQYHNEFFAYAMEILKKSS